MKNALNNFKIWKNSFYIFIIIFLLNACLNNQRKTLIVATTTSLYDSGLLDIIIPIFEKHYGYEVKILAVGSGEALKMGERGDADVLLVHDPISEENFMKKGYGKTKKKIMYNNFILLGPQEDPTNIKGLSIIEAFKKIAEKKALFVSRGDNSGTHKKELKIWEKAEIKPGGDWYIETGQGMGISLRIASEKGGYILSDRATYNILKENLNLEIMIEKEKILYNPYHIIIVNQEKFPSVNYSAAKDFMKFIFSKEVQSIIRNFGKDKCGEALFYIN
ncbi:substrate-binding domain-containing protein [Candidatus Aminicenantes bacterium AH-873-B07]|nr:substrate-binding domain-containing protein [Candidatus Aminicenantes bacterium AH-873-B07]